MTGSAEDLLAPSRAIFLRGLLDACHKSYWACIPVHNSGVVPRASDSRSAISAEIPALPFNRRDSATRVTRRCLAAAVTDTGPRYSRSTLPGWGGLCMRMVNTSVIVLIIHQHGVFTVKREGKTPVAADIYRPMTFQITAQSMQPPAGRIHIFRNFGVVQRKKLLAEPFCVLRLDARLRACLEEALYAPVPEAFYHRV